MSSRAAWWATLTVGSLCSYFLIVFFHGSEILGIRLRSRHLLIGIPLVVLAVGRLLGSVQRRRGVSDRALWVASVSTLTALLALLVADTATTLRESAEYEFDELPRALDPVRWLGPSLAPKYYPTDRNFQLFKPKVRMAAEVYGPAYRPARRQSPTILDHVLEPKSIEYAIDAHGFRETTPPQEAEVFALGDGLVAGSFSKLEDHWVERLERMTGTPIYNLGVGGSSPKQQVMLLEHLLQTRPELFRVKRLLWMINESGDLEGSYQTFHGLPSSRRDPLQGSLVRGLSSLADGLGSLLSTIRCQSMIERWIRVGTGCVRWEVPLEDPHWVVDGVLLARPLYRSERFGYKVFDAVLLEKAAEGPDYVLDHPNRPLLDQTFQEMKSLSESAGFEVTVLIAPNDVRLYAPYFEDFPPISEKPHFIDYVEGLARRSGFEVINLYPLMKPRAARELLNWRDDTHWNPRGEQLVAEILRGRL